MFSGPPPYSRSFLCRMSTSPNPVAAVCQVTATPDKEANFSACKQLLEEARQRGACMVFLPEGFDYIGSSREETLSMSEPLGGDIISRYTQLARWGNTTPSLLSNYDMALKYVYMFVHSSEDINIFSLHIRSIWNILTLIFYFYIIVILNSLFQEVGCVAVSRRISWTRTRLGERQTYL